MPSSGVHRRAASAVGSAHEAEGFLTNGIDAEPRPSAAGLLFFWLSSSIASLRCCTPTSSGRKSSPNCVSISLALLRPPLESQGCAPGNQTCIESGLHSQLFAHLPHYMSARLQPTRENAYIETYCRMHTCNIQPQREGEKHPPGRRERGGSCRHPSPPNLPCIRCWADEALPCLGLDNRQMRGLQADSAQARERETGRNEKHARALIPSPTREGTVHALFWRYPPPPDGRVDA